MFVVPEYLSGDQIKKNELTGHVVIVEKGLDVHRVWLGKPEGKRQLEDLYVDGMII